MELVDLGRSGLRVTPIGLGMASIGRPAYINLGHGEDLGADRSVAAVQAQAVDVLDTAWEQGVRHVDAARSYGRAEEFLAAWMEARELGREDLTVSSKWGYEYTADWLVDPPSGKHEEKNHSVEHLHHQLHRSTRQKAGRFHFSGGPKVQKNGLGPVFRRRRTVTRDHRGHDEDQLPHYSPDSHSYFGAKFVVELLQLRHLLHDFLAHKKRCV